MRFFSFNNLDFKIYLIPSLLCKNSKSGKAVNPLFRGTFGFGNKYLFFHSAYLLFERVVSFLKPSAEVYTFLIKQFKLSLHLN